MIVHYNITKTVNWDSKRILFCLFYCQASHTYLMVFQFKRISTVAIKKKQGYSRQFKSIKEVSLSCGAPASDIEQLLSTSYSLFYTADESEIRKDIADSLREYRYSH